MQFPGYRVYTEHGVPCEAITVIPANDGLSAKLVGCGDGSDCTVYCFAENGKEHADIISSLPIFSFDNTLPVEIWDGLPDSGHCLYRGDYYAPSQYNRYQENTFSLTSRLYGIHTISIRLFSPLSLQGLRMLP